jgi:hypothetical protein
MKVKNFIAYLFQRNKNKYILNKLINIYIYTYQINYNTILIKINIYNISIFFYNKIFLNLSLNVIYKDINISEKNIKYIK